MPIDYLPQSWIAHMRKFLTEIDGKIHIPEVWLPSHRREYNSFIMEDANTLKMSAANKQRVNDCRLYLRAITKSDIATADGTEIDVKLFDGKSRLATTLEFPNRLSPSQELENLQINDETTVRQT